MRRGPGAPFLPRAHFTTAPLPYSLKMYVLAKQSSEPLAKKYTDDQHPPKHKNLWKHQNSEDDEGKDRCMPASCAIA